MRVAVLRFPGSNCDQDALHCLRDDLGIGADYVWHEDRDLAGFDAVFIPGGFTYGDYLRCGAIASRSPIMEAVRGFARTGGPVIGVCNGFQVLCEAAMLPGALMRNASQKFVCDHIWLTAAHRGSPFTQSVDRVLRIPIAHGEGRYVADEETLRRVEGEGLVAFRYCGPNGERAPRFNPNGSMDDIAGIVNEAGNVLGMMPHPERATKSILGSVDGRLILAGLAALAA